MAPDARGYFFKEIHMDTSENIEPKGSKITLDKERILFFNLKSIRNMLREHGTLGDIMSFFASLDGLNASNFSAEALDKIASLIAIGLQHDDETVTADFVLDYLTFDNLASVGNALGESLSACLPRAKENP